MSERLDVEIHRRLAALGATVGVAESLTGGLIGAQLSRMPGSSATFRGSLVVYATDLKATLAGVPEEVLAQHGAVSEATAAALADGARRRLQATYGLGATGVAGPDRQEGQPVGMVYLAWAGPDGAPVVVRYRWSGTREEIRSQAVAAALALLRDALPA